MIPDEGNFLPVNIPVGMKLQPSPSPKSKYNRRLRWRRKRRREKKGGLSVCSQLKHRNQETV